MKLSIIIVSWNVREDLVRCLQSIEKNPPCCDFEIIVIDNASTDGTVEKVKKDFSTVMVVANSENRGFAAANNQGVKLAQGQYLLLLNPDTILHPQSLDILINFMDSNQDVGVVGPKLMNINGTIQKSTRQFPTFKGALHRHTAFKFLGLFKGEYKKWLMKDFKCDIQKDVDQVMGAALMTRKSVIEQIGAMDENFFMYYEEVDLCYRIKKAGWRIVYLPNAVITHLGGSSANQIPVDKRIMAMTSLVNFFRKHRGKFATGVFICIFKPTIVLRDLINVATGFVTYMLATMALNKKKQQKSVAKVKSSIALLSRYSWGSLSKI